MRVCVCFNITTTCLTENEQLHASLHLHYTSVHPVPCCFCKAKALGAEGFIATEADSVKNRNSVRYKIPRNTFPHI